MPERIHPVLRVRKRPVVVEAMHYDGSVEDARDLQAWSKGAVTIDNDTDMAGTLFLRVQTLEGPMRASPGDVLIRGVKGEFYACKPDVFLATYDELAACLCGCGLATCTKKPAPADCARCGDPCGGRC